MSLRFAVIYGSVRSERQGIKGARFVARMLEGRRHQVMFIDPLEYPLPFLDKMYKEYPPGEAPEVMEELAKIYRAADAFVIVSGEYNHSLPPALSNLIDHFMNEYFWRPAGIATYSHGPFGGVRAAEHLRGVLGEVGMVTVPTIFPMSAVDSSFDEHGNAVEKAYEQRIQQFLIELEWYAEALKAQRGKGVPY